MNKLMVKVAGGVLAAGVAVTALLSGGVAGAQPMGPAVLSDAPKSDLMIESANITTELGGHVLILSVKNTGPQGTTKLFAAKAIVNGEARTVLFPLIAAGETVTKGITLPEDLPAGKYTVNIFVDYTNNVHEINESNNVTDLFLFVP